MSRANLTPDIVAATGATLLDRDGLGGLTLGRVAQELGVKTPSLYNHVNGLDGLLRAVKIAALDEFTSETRDAVMGRAGKDALRSWALACRSFALRRPGAYSLLQVINPDDTELAAIASRAVEPVIAALREYGLRSDRAIHAVRAVRAAVHGFAVLDTTGGFGMDVDPAKSFDFLIDLLDAGLIKS